MTLNVGLGVVEDPSVNFVFVGAAVLWMLMVGCGQCWFGQDINGVTGTLMHGTHRRRPML